MMKQAQEELSSGDHNIENVDEDGPCINMVIYEDIFVLVPSKEQARRRTNKTKQKVYFQYTLFGRKVLGFGYFVIVIYDISF
jgi:hypothetical protein